MCTKPASTHHLEPAETTKISDKIYFIISLVFQVVFFLQVLWLNFCMNFSPLASVLHIPLASVLHIPLASVLHIPLASVLHIPLASVLHIPRTHLPWYHDSVW